jgi:hypothetical protein
VTILAPILTRLVSNQCATASGNASVRMRMKLTPDGVGRRHWSLDHDLAPGQGLLAKPADFTAS